MSMLDDNAANAAGDEAGNGGGRGKAKKRKAAAPRSKNGRRKRGPSDVTVQKQLWVVDKLKADPSLTVHQLMDMVKEKFPKMLSFERTKEAKAAFQGGDRAIEQLKEGTFQGSSTGRRGGGGGGGVRGDQSPKFMIATKRRSRWTFESAQTESEANRIVQELVGAGESPSVYRRVDLKVKVQIRG